jgi:hypothetical protein
MFNPKKQKGASTPLVILFIAMAMIILTVAFKLYPVFYENWQLQHVVESFQDEVDLKDLSLKEIRRRFDTRLLTNNVRDFNADNNVSITKNDGTLNILVQYEVRVPIYKNIDAIVSFEETLEKAL